MSEQPNVFFNPLNYLLALEQAPEGLKDGELFSTLLNPLASGVSYTIRAKPEGVEMKRGKIEGTLIFDIKNEGSTPLLNYSSNTDHYLDGIRVRNIKIDAPYLAPGGGDNLRQSWKSSITRLRGRRRVKYWIKGYVKGLNFNQKINISKYITVKTT